MATPLFSFPPGLLGYLRQKVGGQAPDKFGDTLTPTFDIGDLYGRAENVVVANGIGVLGPSVLGTVPANERWWLQAFSVELDNPSAGQTYNVNLAIDTGAGTPLIAVSESQFSALPAPGAVRTLIATLPGRWILEPGSRLLVDFQIPSTFTAVWGATGTARILRLAI